MSQFQRFVAFLGCAVIALLAAFPPNAGGIHSLIFDGGSIDYGRLAAEIIVAAAATAAVVLLSGGRHGLPHEGPK